MFRLFIITISILYSSITLAKSSYQIDLILFAHPQKTSTSSALDNSGLVPFSKNAIALKSGSKSSQPYSLLPPSQAGLADEYYQLTHRSRYPVLGRYSWIQPAGNKSTVSLPLINNKGWEIQGTIQVEQSNYYAFNAELHCSPPSNPQSSFIVSQKQRLKAGTVYYLDNPQIGMLVKVHKLT
jgi:hypothetical protein